MTRKQALWGSFELLRHNIREHANCHCQSAVICKLISVVTGKLSEFQLDFRRTDIHYRTWRAASLQLKTYLNLNLILQKVYLFCGILTFIPVVLSCLFSMRLCRKLEQKSKAKSRILTYILVSVGFYPQYLATRFLNLLSLTIKVITLIFQNNFDRVRLSWG